MTKRILILFIPVLALLLLAMPVAAAAEHCPGEPGGNANKIEVGTDPSEGDIDIDGTTVHYVIDGATVTFDTEVVFCVKAGEQASGELTGTTFTVTWLNNGGQTPAISYVVIYSLVTATPTPTPVVDQPTPTPVETPPTPAGGGHTPSEIPNTAIGIHVPTSTPFAPLALLIIALAALAIASVRSRRA